MIIPSPFIAMLEVAFNRALALDPDALKKFIALSGKKIGVELRGLDLHIYFLPALDGVQLRGAIDGEPDTLIRGKPGALLHTALTQDRKALFEGEVEILGDIDLGRKFNRILENIDIDWEEPLSQLVGDVAAHQIGNAARSIFGWFGQAVQSLSRDTAEYFQEESRDLPSRYEVEEFNKNVDTVRSDVERMSQRVARLESRLQEREA